MGNSGAEGFFRKAGQKRPLWGDMNQRAEWSKGVNWIFGERVF